MLTLGSQSFSQVISKVLTKEVEEDVSLTGLHFEDQQTSMEEDFTMGIVEVDEIHTHYLENDDTCYAVESRIAMIGGDEDSFLSDEFSDDDFGNLEEDGDSVIAKAMNALSIDERRQALHDIHGVSDVEEDDFAVLAPKLVQLELELSKISNKKAYNMAKESSPDYVANPEFRMLFLRSDELKPCDAANRIVRHFEMKLELFGPKLLGRDIYMSDFEPDDMKVMESGYMQWLNQRDRAGRAVACWTPGGHVWPVRNRFRVQWFGMMNALRDEDTQKRGMVMVVFSVGIMGDFDPQAAIRMPRFSRSLPTRFVAIHACYEKSRSRPIIDTVLRGIGSFHQVRYRSHYGSSSECLYALMTFGIPSSALPVNADGSITRKDHVDRQKKRRSQEQETSKPDGKIIFIPGPFDVLLGRGKLSQENLGNLRYRGLIATYQERYEAARKVEKTKIAAEVVKMVKDCSGRFLTAYYADFIEISDTRAREKASHSFRSLRLKKQAQTQRSRNSKRLGMSTTGYPTDDSIDPSEVSSGEEHSNKSSKTSKNQSTFVAPEAIESDRNGTKRPRAV